MYLHVHDITIGKSLNLHVLLRSCPTTGTVINSILRVTVYCEMYV